MHKRLCSIHYVIVMVLESSKYGIFRLAEKLQTILRLTKTHAMNLAKFVFSYKLCQGILQRLEGERVVYCANRIPLFLRNIIFLCEELVALAEGVRAGVEDDDFTT